MKTFLHFASTNIEEGGICYRLYPQTLFNEKINENINSEMARQPLLVSRSLSFAEKTVVNI